MRPRTQRFAIASRRTAMLTQTVIRFERKMAKMMAMMIPMMMTTKDVVPRTKATAESGQSQRKIREITHPRTTRRMT
jgi:hypothetical protein